MESQYCNRRKDLVKLLSEATGQVPLSQLQKKCIYKCNGFDYSCPKYSTDLKNLSQFPKAYKPGGPD